MNNEEETLNDHLNELLDTDLTLGEKTADWVAEFVGSWKFIIILALGLTVWIAFNVWVISYGIHILAFDPPPFILLNLILSFIAAFQVPLIMMSQNRISTKDRLRDEVQYDTTQEIRTELFMIQEEIQLLKEELKKNNSK